MPTLRRKIPIISHFTSEKRTSPPPRTTTTKTSKRIQIETTDAYPVLHIYLRTMCEQHVDDVDATPNGRPHQRCVPFLPTPLMTTSVNNVTIMCAVWWKLRRSFTSPISECTKFPVKCTNDRAGHIHGPVSPPPHRVPVVP